MIYEQGVGCKAGPRFFMKFTNTIIKYKGNFKLLFFSAITHFNNSKHLVIDYC
jgi:hypothetical protein